MNEKLEKLNRLNSRAIAKNNSIIKLRKDREKLIKSNIKRILNEILSDTHYEKRIEFAEECFDYSNAFNDIIMVLPSAILIDGIYAEKYNKERYHDFIETAPFISSNNSRYVRYYISLMNVFEIVEPNKSFYDALYEVQKDEFQKQFEEEFKNHKDVIDLLNKQKMMNMNFKYAFRLFEHIDVINKFIPKVIENTWADKRKDPETAASYKLLKVLNGCVDFLKPYLFLVLPINKSSTVGVNYNLCFDLNNSKLTNKEASDLYLGYKTQREEIFKELNKKSVRNKPLEERIKIFNSLKDAYEKKHPEFKGQPIGLMKEFKSKSTLYKYLLKHFNVKKKGDINVTNPNINMLDIIL